MPPDTAVPRDLLIRLDERTANILQEVADIKASQANFVTRSEFAPVRALVFGAVAVVLIGFMGVLVTLSRLPSPPA